MQTFTGVRVPRVMFVLVNKQTLVTSVLRDTLATHEVRAQARLCLGPKPVFRLTYVRQG